MYFCLWEPFKDPNIYTIEVINEVIITLMIFLLPALLKTSFSAPILKGFGWLFIALICLLVLVNTIWIISMMFHLARPPPPVVLEPYVPMPPVQETPQFTLEDVEPEMTRSDAKDLVKLFL